MFTLTLPLTAIFKLSENYNPQTTISSCRDAVKNRIFVVVLFPRKSRTHVSAALDRAERYDKPYVCL